MGFREFFLASVMSVFTVAQASAELIILAAPGGRDPYYADVADQIFDFHVNYAQRILAAGDDVIVLTDAQVYDDYASALGAAHVSVNPQLDIWARDFGSANAEAPVMFRYTAAGQGGGRRGQSDADAVQEVLAVAADASGMGYQISDLLNDGGC